MGLCMIGIGILGGIGPYIAELIFPIDSIPTVYLSISNLFKESILLFIVVLGSGWMLVTCVSEYESEVLGEV